jgi:CAAX amino terminal protease family.
VYKVTWNTLTTKFLFDYLAMLLLPSIILIIYRKQLYHFKVCMNSKYEIIALFGVMILLFILHSNFGISGIYPFFFYLVVIAFGEEFIFRGFIYNKIKSHSKFLAIIISGVLWGVPHAILPTIISNGSLSELFLTMLTQICGGILMGWYFIFLLEKSKTLWIPILIHAILDYTVGFIGVIVQVTAFIYFLKKSSPEKYDPISEVETPN